MFIIHMNIDAKLRLAKPKSTHEIKIITGQWLNIKYLCHNILMKYRLQCEFSVLT